MAKHWRLAAALPAAAAPSSSSALPSALLLLPDSGQCFLLHCASVCLCLVWLTDWLTVFVLFKLKGARVSMCYCWCSLSFLLDWRVHTEGRWQSENVLLLAVSNVTSKNRSVFNWLCIWRPVYMPDTLKQLTAAAVDSESEFCSASLLEALTFITNTSTLPACLLDNLSKGFLQPSWGPFQQQFAPLSVLFSLLFMAAVLVVHMIFPSLSPKCAAINWCRELLCSPLLKECCRRCWWDNQVERQIIISLFVFLSKKPCLVATGHSSVLRAHLLPHRHTHCRSDKEAKLAILFFFWHLPTTQTLSLLSFI